jgi:hypothetical protein
MKLLATATLLFSSYCTAWIPAKQQCQKTRHAPTTATSLFNVPPPSTEDKEAFKAFANKQPAPASFFELQQDCIRAAEIAIDEGLQLLEVEFPPLPANVLDLDDVSAYDVAQANLKLALDFAKGFSSDKNVAIMFPDESEARIAVEKLTGKDDIGVVTKVEAGITVSSLRRSDEGDERILKVRSYCVDRFIWYLNDFVSVSQHSTTIWNS